MSKGCTYCGASGRKLWRHPFSTKTILCFKCASAYKNLVLLRTPRPPTAVDLNPSAPFYALVPAVAVNENEPFYYVDPPPAAVAKWQRLPY